MKIGKVVFIRNDNNIYGIEEALLEMHPSLLTIIC